LSGLNPLTQFSSWVITSKDVGLRGQLRRFGVIDPAEDEVGMAVENRECDLPENWWSRCGVMRLLNEWQKRKQEHGHPDFGSG
jgi:hypothetical protein